MLHFVGFAGQELMSALRVFGRPDFWHRLNDKRFHAEVMPGDVVLFARGSEDRPAPFTRDDSAYF